MFAKDRCGPILWPMGPMHMQFLIGIRMSLLSRLPAVIKGQKSKIFKIGQMTYQIEGNYTGNRMQPLARLKYTVATKIFGFRFLPPKGNST